MLLADQQGRLHTAFWIPYHSAGTIFQGSKWICGWGESICIIFLDQRFSERLDPSSRLSWRVSDDDRDATVLLVGILEGVLNTCGRGCGGG